MRLRLSAAFAAGLLALAHACVTGSPCPRDRVCGGGTWIPAGGAMAEGSMVLAPVSDAAGPSTGYASSEHLPVGGRPVLLRFDLSGLDGRGTIERAMLLLSPHPAWRPNGLPVRIFARAIISPWSAYSVAQDGPPILDSVPTAEIALPGDTRTPVRMDVTNALRAWQSGSVAFQGLALSSDDATSSVVFAGLGTYDDASRPRLEVVLR
jgi:hypothetical protein